jgi:hypothetical protein
MRSGLMPQSNFRDIITAPTSRIHASAMLLLLIILNLKVWRWTDFYWHKVHTQFRVNWSHTSIDELGIHRQTLPTQHCDMSPIP